MLLPRPYRAVAELKNRPWVILTNGVMYRLYTDKISASTTNYFEVSIAHGGPDAIRYLVAIFGAKSYEGEKDTIIDNLFEESKTKARALEDDLRSKILKPDGLFLGLVKGALDHNLRKKFTHDELEAGKNTALNVLYRVWFILYAESRNLLPTRNEKYSPISLQTLKGRLDKYEDEPNGDGCWKHMLELFGRIRNGSPEHDLPQYNGGLFKSRADIDGTTIKNRFTVSVLRDLFETNGEPVDYGVLGVRHLGNIYESLLEFSVRQADRDIMLLEDKKGVREVESKENATYSYQKNDLYLASKGGLASRKTSASFYTPHEIVTFLVKRGLEPILEERETKLVSDVRRYKRNPSEKNLQICVDRLLDIQVLDPAMGSGPFSCRGTQSANTMGYYNAGPTCRSSADQDC